MATFLDTEMETLRHFHRKAVELNDAMEHMPDGFSIKVDEKSTEFTGEIDEFETGGFVNITRLFKMEKEDINFHKVRTIIAKYYRNDPTKSELLKNYKKAWNSIFGPNTLVGTNAQLNGKDITNGDIYDLVVYGNHSHIDPIKYKELEKLRSHVLTLMFVEVSFRMVIANIHTVVAMFDAQVIYPILQGKDWPQTLHPVKKNPTRQS